jgi:hypothetical protein
LQQQFEDGQVVVDLSGRFGGHISVDERGRNRAVEWRRRDLPYHGELGDDRAAG